MLSMRGGTFSATEEQKIWQIALDDDRRASSVEVDRGLVLEPPCWSRDGRFVAYQEGRVYDDQGRWLPWGEFSVITQPSGGGTKRLVSHTKEKYFIPQDWSHDGKWLLRSTRDRPETEASN